MGQRLLAMIFTRLSQYIEIVTSRLVRFVTIKELRALLFYIFIAAEKSNLESRIHRDNTTVYLFP